MYYPTKYSALFDATYIWEHPLHVRKSKGILNLLCNVRPPVNNVAAILLDAVANAILPSD